MEVPHSFSAVPRILVCLAVTSKCYLNLAYKILVGKSKGKRPRSRPRSGWEGNIRMDHREIGCKVAVDWMHLPQDRDQWLALVNTVMNLGFP